jgi:uncharacterized protein (DUF302 family)
VKTVLLLLAMLTALPAWAEGAYRAEMKADFVEAMNELQSVIHARGYRVLRVLPVDMGLENVGYSQKPYRIVFFAKDDLKDKLRETPELAVYLPLAITVFESEGITRFLALSPMELPTREASPALLDTLKEWDSDMREIFARFK